MSNTSGSDDSFDSTGVEHMYFNFYPLFPIQAMYSEVNGGLHISLEYFLSTCDDLSACGTLQTRPHLQAEIQSRVPAAAVILIFALSMKDCVYLSIKKIFMISYCMSKTLYDKQLTENMMQHI